MKDGEEVGDGERGDMGEKEENEKSGEGGDERMKPSDRRQARMDGMRSR